jgi:hypothetical protein
MNARLRTIEVDAASAETLERRAEALGVSVAEVVAGLLADEPALEAARRDRTGPWAPEVLAEDAGRLAAFLADRRGAPASEVVEWLESWGTADELPPPPVRRV